jgi:MFS family permease
MIMAFPPVPKTFPQLTHLVAVNVLFLGASNLWWVPLANTFGRRPIVLLGGLMLALFSVWAAVAKSYDSLLAARCLMGLAAASGETISPDVVGEVFFV